MLFLSKKVDTRCPMQGLVDFLGGIAIRSDELLGSSTSFLTGNNNNNRSSSPTPSSSGSSPTSSPPLSPVPSSTPPSTPLASTSTKAFEVDSSQIDLNEPDALESMQDGFHIIETLRDQVANGELFYQDPDEEEISEHGLKILQSLNENFGEVSGPVRERVIAQKSANLYRTVLISGLTTLTNYRITFSAKLPPFEPGKIIKSGSVTYHRPGLRKKKRMWAILRSDYACLYSSASSKYRPQGVLRIASVTSVEYKAPCDVIVHFKRTKDSYITLDSAETAMSWVRALEACLYSFNNAASVIKINIPLNSIKEHYSEPLSDFAWVKTVVVNRHFDNYVGNATASAAGDDDDDDNPIVEDEQDKTQSVQFLLTVDSSNFCQIIQDTFTKAKETIPVPDSDKRLPNGKLAPRSNYPWVEDDSHVPLRAQDSDDPNVASHKATAMRFKESFGLQDDIGDLSVFQCEVIHGHFPVFGNMCFGASHICFWGYRLGTSDLKIMIPYTEIWDVQKIKTHIFGVFGFELRVYAQDPIRFEFFSRRKRNQALSFVQIGLERQPKDSSDAFDKDSGNEDLFKPQKFKNRLSAKQPMSLPQSVNATPIFATIPHNVYCMTIGSRGDVQPYIALCKELEKDGHKCTIVTHEEYKKWIESYGFSFKAIGGNPEDLMKLSLERPIFSPAFFTDSVGKFRGWLDNLLRDSWEACQEAELLIESPSTMAGIHIAEALGIPYFRAFTMPWTRTSKYPHAFASGTEVPLHNNLMTYTLIDNLFWIALSGQVNRWRREVLNIPETDLKRQASGKVPFIYNFSPTVCPPATDWRNWVHVSGYWFLDEDHHDNWKPPLRLQRFLDRAKCRDIPVVYIGFGSIIVDDPVQLTKDIYKAVIKSNVQAIVSRGWSARMHSSNVEEEVSRIPIPEDVYIVDSIPHNWLFKNIDAAVHHGGSGTTGASLRAGLPTVIKPFFGDQFFWASRVRDLGAGIKMNSLSQSELQKALIKATTNKLMKERARVIGEKIRSENGPRNACDFIYNYYDYARRLAEAKTRRNQQSKAAQKPIMNNIGESSKTILSDLLEKNMKLLGQQ